jgi:hypothetical protein
MKFREGRFENTACTDDAHKKQFHVDVRCETWLQQLLDFRDLRGRERESCLRAGQRDLSSAWVAKWTTRGSGQLTPAHDHRKRLLCAAAYAAGLGSHPTENACEARRKSSRRMWAYPRRHGGHPSHGMTR